MKYRVYIAGSAIREGLFTWPDLLLDKTMEYHDGILARRTACDFVQARNVTVEIFLNI